MSMYTNLLGTALDQRDQADRTPSVGELFARCLKSRIALQASAARLPRHAKSLKELTGQLDYDVSLIGLARRLNIAFVVRQFDNGERRRLELLLTERGIALGEG